MGIYSHGADLRGNVTYANTKIHKHWCVNFNKFTIILLCCSSSGSVFFCFCLFRIEKPCSFYAKETIFVSLFHFTSILLLLNGHHTSEPVDDWLFFHLDRLQGESIFQVVAIFFVPKVVLLRFYVKFFLVELLSFDWIVVF